MEAERFTLEQASFALVAFSDALAQRNLPALCAQFTENGLFWGPRRKLKGRGAAELEAVFARLTSSTTRYSFNWGEVDFLFSGKMATIFAEGRCTARKPGQDPVRTHCRISGVLVRRRGIWRWMRMHLSEASDSQPEVRTRPKPALQPQLPPVPRTIR